MDAIRAFEANRQASLLYPVGNTVAPVGVDFAGKIYGPSFIAHLKFLVVLYADVSYGQL